MPIVKYRGHNEAEALAEVLRLFFGSCETGSEQELIAGYDRKVITSILLTHGETYEILTECEQQQTISLKVPSEKFRREIKRQLYCQLEQLTDTHYPWGSLNGVRPTQIVLESYLRNNSNTNATIDELTEYWRLSEEKAKLGLETAIAEKQIMDTLSRDDLFVYAGVPFCPGRCSYCSFIARDAHRLEKWLEPYADTMVEEAKLVFSSLSKPVKALYLGGGTPTSLPDSAFARLLEGLVRYVPLIQGGEWTVEAGRPDTITKTKLELIRQAGADRICINPQTMNDATLERIGRHHTTAQTHSAYEQARALGFRHINMDLIAGLPGEEPNELIRSLNELVKLGPESITIHTLALKRSSGLQQMDNDSLRAASKPQRELTEAIEEAGRILRTGGWNPYYLYRQKEVAGGLENTGFAQEGKACNYNVAMMSDRYDVIGLGSGAVSKKVDGTKVKRVSNSKDLLDYQQRLPELAERKLKLFLA